MRFPRFFLHSITALLCGGLLIETTLAKGDQPNIPLAVQTLIPQVDPTNTNVFTDIGVSYPYPAAPSIKHKSSGGSIIIINSKDEGYDETEVPSLYYVTTTAITFVDILVLPESEEDDDENEDDRGSNTEMMPTEMMPTEMMPTWTVFFFAAVLDVVIRGAFV